MKRTLAILLIVAFGFLPLEAEPLVLKNRFLEVSSPASGEVLISQLRYLPKEVDNLRAAPEGDDFLPFGEESSPEAGLRIAEVSREGNRQLLSWKAEEQGDGKVVWQDEEGRWEIEGSLSSAPQSSSFLLRIARRTAEAGSKLELSLMLQVGGTFLGVPTEGPADFLIVPLEQNGPAVQPIAIHGKSDTSYRLAAPWWAVGDRVVELLLACRVEPAAALDDLHQWSGVISPHEALRQTTSLTVGEDPVLVQLAICDPLYRLSGITSRVAAYIARDERSEGHAELHLAPIQALGKGRVSVIANGAELASLPIADWKPGELHKLSLGEISSEKPLRLKMEADGIAEETPLLPERTPKL